MHATTPVMQYTPAQRWLALLYGLVSHTLFLASVVMMFVSLYHGLHGTLLHLHGSIAFAINALLIAQFPLGHSLLLSDKGRRWMSRLAPLALGRDLSTTIFAAIASLQLLVTFGFWSSSEVLWAAPEGTIKSSFSIMYVISWILLAKSMSDAGLDTQIGSLGWRSVWSGTRPVYRPFSRTGMFIHSRQPIYSSFTLILWTAPVWTPDHLFIAVSWTIYCVLAPLLKERRFLRYYGAAFARYQARVPYWFPRLGRISSPAVPEAAKSDYDVIIVGAGPVGLLLGCLLGQRGFSVLIADQRTEPPAHSQAIGITPPSLQILARLGLDQAFIRRGVPIRDCHVHGQSGYLGCASFRDIASPYRHILSLPQQINVSLLETKLAEFPNVTLRRGLEVTHADQTARQVTLRGQCCGLPVQATAKWLIGCDGHRSRVRQLIQMRTRGGDYRCHFLMGDFMDATAFGDEAHLFFTADGAVESFPLPDGKRRWIVQTKTSVADAPPGFISHLIKTRTSLEIPAGAQLNQSPFTPRWMEAEQYHDGRVILCGDAAHLMSPIGGQGMNTGWADAEFLAEILTAIEHRRQHPAPLLAAYDRCRRQAARTAIHRAARGMWLGSRTGMAQTLLRDLFMRHLLFKGPFSHHIGSYFAMLTIPGNTVAHLPAKILSKITPPATHHC